MEQIMTQPDPQVGTITLQSVEWNPEVGRLDFTVRFSWDGGQEWEDKEFTIEEEKDIYDQRDYFLDIIPKGDYSYKEDGYFYARLDDHFNLCWLVKDDKGLIHYKVIYLKPILESIAEEKS